MAKHEYVDRDYRSYVVTRRSILGVLVGLVVLAAFIAVLIGPTKVPTSEILGILLAGPGGESVASTIVWNIRLPRVLGAAVIGASLALSGAVMQSVLNNPLGSPYTLGISQAAMFGAAAAIVFLGAGSITIGETVGISFSNPYVVTTVAFLSSPKSGFLTGVAIPITGGSHASTL